MNPSVPVRCYSFEETWAKIEVIKGASPAGVHDRSLGGSTGVRIEDRDGLAANGVGVGVWPVIHLRDREGDDGLAVVVRFTA